MPKSSGFRSDRITLPSDRIAKSVPSAKPASSKPSRPWRTIALSMLRCPRAFAIASKTLGSNTPITCPTGRRGFTKGPKRLNTVRTFRVRRKGATAFIAGCQPGANRKVIPTCSTAALTFSRGAPKLTPNPSNTSAEPTLLEAERFPCLATGTPAAAHTNATAVEILKVDAPSPPVPQVSIRENWDFKPSALGVGRFPDWDCDCNTFAIPANSSPDTPLVCNPTKIAPDNTGGIDSLSHPSIKIEAWSVDRD
uniref:Uncharacterized protein n=1 Tax=Limnospira platensis TaxID=118562 RepID=Q307D4_LIMPL|nr:unknown [Arthrospira platensis]